MTAVFGVPLPAILGQLMLGLVNGSFYALLSLGLAVIFGLLGVVNFAHGAFYMLGAFAAYVGWQFLGVNYWCALLLATSNRSEAAVGYATMDGDTSGGNRHRRQSHFPCQR